jgi:hypothetical protein
MRFWQQLLQLMELTACGSLADHYKQITSSQACSTWCCILNKKRARNKQANNQAKEAHQKKTVHKVFPQTLQKTCESEMQ